MASPDKILQCPLCLETMTKPIVQCKIGHSMCKVCVEANSINICPVCRGEMSTTRNFQMEQLIESLNISCKIKCDYTARGCKFLLAPKDKSDHEAECKYRNFQCEGKKFAKWSCQWTGELKNMEKHFKDHHNNNTWMTFRTEANLKINLNADFNDVHIINFHNGQNFFWYKHRVSVADQKAYWTVQFVGTEAMAKHYYYEFEIYNGPVRRFKIMEICENDVVDAHKIFQSEKCVVLSFKTLKSYFNEEGELPFKFRIMSIRATTRTSK